MTGSGGAATSSGCAPRTRARSPGRGPHGSSGAGTVSRSRAGSGNAGRRDGRAPNSTRCARPPGHVPGPPAHAKRLDGRADGDKRQYPERHGARGLAAGAQRPAGSPRTPPGKATPPAAVRRKVCTRRVRRFSSGCGARRRCHPARPSKTTAPPRTRRWCPLVGHSPIAGARRREASQAGAGEQDSQPVQWRGHPRAGAATGRSAVPPA